MRWLILLIVFLAVVIPPGYSFASECEVLDFSTYESISGHITDGEGSVSQARCAVVTIKNTSIHTFEYISDYYLTATFADGKTLRKRIGGDSFRKIEDEGTITKCFGRNRPPIVKVECGK